MSLPVVRVEIGFTSAFVDPDVWAIGDPVRGRIGTAKIGSDDIWVDVTEWVRSWSVRRGASQGNQPVLRCDPGTATIVLNDPDRWFDPDNLAGPFVSAGESQVTPMRRVRIVAEWNGIVYPIFYGWSDDWVPDYQGNFWTYCTLTATDGTKVVAAVDRQATGIAGAGEDSGARVARILGSAGWPPEDRILSVGDETLQGTILEGNALSELQLVQDTELGMFYFDASGKAVFRNRRWTLTDPRATTSQVLFGDEAGELPYTDVTMATSGDAIINQVSIARVGGTVQTATDAASVARFLPRGFDRGDLLMETDASALNYATLLKGQFSSPRRRFERLEFGVPTPQDEDALWPAVLERDFGDRITIRRRPFGGGDPIERACFVRGVEMSSDGESWRTSFVLSSAAGYSYWTIGHPDLGRIGRYPIAY